MSAALERPNAISTTCPGCGDGGPHMVLPDDPDPHMAYRLPLHCQVCAAEFLYLNGSAPPDDTPPPVTVE